jgi:nitrite reductase/ring-hydroxylating ferredoxin subunit
MKKYLTLLLVFPLFMSCASDDFNYNNPYLPDSYNFTLDVDMTLPLYSPLQYTGNPVRVNIAGYGIHGIIIMNTGSGFTAYEATCPNQEISGCSNMTLSGINAICPCDDVAYSLFTGQPNTNLRYSLMPYRVEILSPTYLRISN